MLIFFFQHFVLEEDMLEVDCSCVTLEVVLQASGHVDNFTDLMVKDEKTGTCYRANHLLKDFCNDKLGKDTNIITEKVAELGAKSKEYGITAPATNNTLSTPYPFNLTFQTSIGLSGASPDMDVIMFSFCFSKSFLNLSIILFIYKVFFSMDQFPVMFN